MTYLDSGLISNYWFETGTPTWLVKQMSAVGMVDPTTKLWLAPQLMSFDLRELESVPILFQTGYLEALRLFGQL